MVLKSSFIYTKVYEANLFSFVVIIRKTSISLDNKKCSIALHFLELINSY